MYARHDIGNREAARTRVLIAFPSAVARTRRNNNNNEAESNAYVTTREIIGRFITTTTGIQAEISRNTSSWLPAGKRKRSLGCPIDNDCESIIDYRVAARPSLLRVSGLGFPASPVESNGSRCFLAR